MKEQTTMTFEIGAYYRMNGDVALPDQPSWFTAVAYFATVEEAKAFAAQYPKSLRLCATRLGGRPGTEGIVKFDVRLSPDGVTGSSNEAGLKRIARFIRTFPAVWTAQCLNSYSTMAEFLAAAKL